MISKRDSWLHALEVLSLTVEVKPYDEAYAAKGYGALYRAILRDEPCPLVFGGNQHWAPPRPNETPEETP